MTTLKLSVQASEVEDYCLQLKLLLSTKDSSFWGGTPQEVESVVRQLPKHIRFSFYE